MRRKWQMILIIPAAILLLLGAGWFLRQSAAFPDHFWVSAGEPLTVSGMEVEVLSTQGSASNGYHARLTWMGIPVKDVLVTERQRPMVVPCGTPFGIKLFTNGILVVGTERISGTDGDCDPAKIAGLQQGDLITEINGIAASSAKELKTAIVKSSGRPLTLTIRRGEATEQHWLTPVRSAYDGSWQGGIWARDSTAGIGMVTFYRPETGAFAGLGHGICDVDTAALMPLREGAIVPVSISGIRRGSCGSAGALQGYFTTEQASGTVRSNTEEGVYGTLHRAPAEHTAVPVAYRQEVQTGEAEILTAIHGTQTERYTVEIESIDLREDDGQRDLVLRVTDPRLLAETGGIVQGMSGSPILQNGRLVGAVTHVFLNDPTHGYGIFAETMVAHGEAESAH